MGILKSTTPSFDNAARSISSSKTESKYDVLANRLLFIHREKDPGKKTKKINLSWLLVIVCYL